MNNMGKVFTTAAVSAVAGAVLGVLFAPEKGTDTRKNISKKSKDLVNKFNGKVNDTRKKMMGASDYKSSSDMLE